MALTDSELGTWKGIDRASVIAAESRTGGAFEHEDNRAATTEGLMNEIRAMRREMAEQLQALRAELHAHVRPGGAAR